MKILLVDGKEVCLDDEDFERISRYTWRLNKWGYPQRSYHKKDHHFKMGIHREVLNIGQRKITKIEIDHINGNKLDNRKGNLRICTRSDNLRNVGLRKDNTSGYKGVAYDKSRGKTKPWRAKIDFNGKTIYVGRFSDKLEAAKAYNDAAKKYFGDFAYLNKLP